MENKKVLKLILWGTVIFLTGLFLFIKMDFQKSFAQAVQSPKVWVYAKIQTEMVRDTTDYFYYGQINKSVIDEIDIDRNIDGLFILSNIRFWNDDDLLEVYEDDESAGYKIFKIQNIQYIQEYKKDPVFIFDEDELHVSAKEIRGVFSEVN